MLQRAFIPATLLAVALAVCSLTLFHGRYQIEQSFPGTVARLDTLTGDVSFCYVQGDERTTRCGEWGPRQTAFKPLD